MPIDDEVHLRITIRVNIPKNCKLNIYDLLHSCNLFTHGDDLPTTIAIDRSYFSFFAKITSSKQNIEKLIKIIEQEQDHHGFFLLTDFRLEFIGMSLFWFAISLPQNIFYQLFTNYSYYKKNLVCNISRECSINDIIDLLKVVCFLSG